MKINIKERLKNKAFVITMATMIIAFVYQLLGLFGVVPAVSEDSLMKVIMLGINLLAALGILVDPTTKGLSDSQRALSYGTDYDIRLTEEAAEIDEGDTENGNV